MWKSNNSTVLNPIQTGLLLVFWNRDAGMRAVGGGGGGGGLGGGDYAPPNIKV